MSVNDAAATGDPPPKSVEELLDDLQRESEMRRVELREIAAQLPAAMSRRAVLRKIAGDFRHAPEKGDIATRAVHKIARGPRTAVRWLKRTVAPSAR